MKLTNDEKELIFQRRAEKEAQEKLKKFRIAALKTAFDFENYSQNSGAGLTFSTFINDFGYQYPDGQEMFSVVSRLIGTINTLTSR